MRPFSGFPLGTLERFQLPVSGFDLNLHDENARTEDLQQPDWFFLGLHASSQTVATKSLESAGLCNQSPRAVID